MTFTSVIRQGALHTHFHDGFRESDHDYLIAFHSNFLSGMYSFRDNEVLLQVGHDVIMISPPGGAARNFYDAFWKSDRDFLIVIQSNFLFAMQGFRDNEF